MSSKGSEWNKWDLHIHTPSSINQSYGKDNDDAWEQYISELEKLPKEFKVIGINDYLFLDGYEKVIKFKNSGRLPNIVRLILILMFEYKNIAR